MQPTYAEYSLFFFKSVNHAAVNWDFLYTSKKAHLVYNVGQVQSFLIGFLHVKSVPYWKQGTGIFTITVFQIISLWGYYILLFILRYINGSCIYTCICTYICIIDIFLENWPLYNYIIKLLPLFYNFCYRVNFIWHEHDCFCSFWF